MEKYIISFDDVLSALDGIEDQPTSPCSMSDLPTETNDFDRFKQFVLEYVAEHDELPENHQALGQIANSNTVDSIESFLRQNGDYCDDCMLKLYRKYAAGKDEPEAPCPCGGE